MRELYQNCKICNKLSPLPKYFYEKNSLTEEEKSCIWCVEKIKNQTGTKIGNKKGGSKMILLTEILKSGDRIIDPNLRDSYVVEKIKEDEIICKGGHIFDKDTVNKLFMRYEDFKTEYYSFRLNPVRRTDIDYSKYL